MRTRRVQRSRLGRRGTSAAQGTACNARQAGAGEAASPLFQSRHLRRSHPCTAAARPFFSALSERSVASNEHQRSEAASRQRHALPAQALCFLQWRAPRPPLDSAPATVSVGREGDEDRHSDAALASRFCTRPLSPHALLRAPCRLLCAPCSPLAAWRKLILSR